MANAVQAFIERQGMKLPAGAEPVLIAGEPGLHIESVRPAVKAVMIDGIKSFVSGLATGGHTLTPEQVYEFTERIINPRPPRTERKAPVAPPAGEQEMTPHEDSRARAIFNASEQAKPIGPADFDFAIADEQPLMEAPRDSNLAMPEPRPQARSNRILGMTPTQVAVIAGLGLALLCLLAVFAYIISTAS